MDSRNCHCFCSEVSRFINPGPTTEFRGSFPNVNAAGSEKATLLNHCRAVFGPLFGLNATFGRSRLLPLTSPIFATSLSELKFTVNGAPLWAIRIPLTRQPEATARRQPPAPLANGKSYRTLPTKLLR